jgi:hypothetical protein
LKEGAVDGSRERDRSVERLLRQSLQTPRNGGVTDSCLDAETLAAWIDGGLSGAALEMAQSHVADCARCQTMVGALARINSGVPLAKPEHTPRRWLAWLVPLTAAAAAVALWVAVPRDTGAPLARATEVRKSADASNAQEPRLADNPSQTPAREVKERSAEARARSKDERLAPTVVSGGSAKKETARRDQPPLEANELKDANRLEADSLRPNVSGATARSVAGAAPAPSVSPPAAAPSALAETVTVGRLSAQLAKAAGFEIVSPDPAVRWRIAGSVVQRSANGGSSWQTVSTGIAAELTAGAAPSPSVCWIVGRGGVVLLSSDGSSWRRVAFPEAVDLSAVQAVDALTALVTAADGRTFSTTDGGATWVRR